MTITNCKVDHLTNPLGYALDGTTFSWTVEDSQGKFQTAARVVVKRGGAVEADTGWADLDSLAAPVEFPLRPRTRYTWTVSVRTDAGEEQTSAENWFETGKLDEPWAASWIGCDDSQPRHPVFSREIVPVKPVAAARLYICGLGLYECAWNGEKIGGEYLAPYCNDYNSWVQYQTYDVTEQLQTAGTLSVTLGNGWYKGRFGFDRQETPYYGDSWKLLTELRLTYADGTQEVAGTDESWAVARSNITFSNLYDGEHRDDTLPDLPQEGARLVEPPAGKLTERYSTPTDTFMGFHCGNTPACKLCADRAVKYQLIQHRLLEPKDSDPDFTRGTLEGDIAPSNITFYRLQCDSNGTLRSYIAQGEVLPVKTGSFGGIGVFAIHEMGRFYRHVLIQKRYPHHGAVAFGHYGKALFEVFKFLGVQNIAYNQPKTLPYPTENPWN